MRRKSQHTWAVIKEMTALTDNQTVNIRDLMEVYLKVEKWNFDKELSDMGLGELNYKFFYKKVYGIMHNLMDAEFRLKWEKIKIGRDILFRKNPMYVLYKRY
jgi:hypothetical protein